MKKIILIIIIAFCATAVYSQNASTYFPSSPGYKWFYKNTPLDSLNNPQNNLATFQVDSFAQNTTYNGLPASQVLSKSGLLSINQNTPYTDTNYLNFQSTNAYPYLNVLGLIGSLPGLDSVAFVEFLKSFNGWYNTYRFSQTVNTNYTIFSRDTTLNIDTLSLPLRISSTGRRLTDQTISTVNGNYLCKKFLLTFKIELAILPPILYIPIVTLPDTTYITSDIWVVKESSPSVNVDLSGLGFPIDFTIPGSLKELTSSSVGISTLNNSIADKFELSQNYPNPFNPTTNLEFGISELGFVSLKVYNASGKEVQTLVNEKMPAGKYSVTFDGSNLSSGIYFYKLESGGFVETKSMILLK
ncbi:MAG: T9SS type A sorting domain-containing protein [Ignavibacteriae bacterium]|nr:T9SS type A sorting domain-containing protein [Ignavibacteriota bacterium]